MAKKGMARPEWTHIQPRNAVPPVPELQGKAKHGKEPARPIIVGTEPPAQKVYHGTPIPKADRHSPDAYQILDNDLARDNLENDIPAADLQDL